MPHPSDGALLTEVEEWITAKESLLYIRVAFELILDMDTLFMLGGKFGLIKKFEDMLLFNAKELTYTINRCYFPSIPKGWLSVDAILAKYPYMTWPTLKNWIKNKKIYTRKIEIGVEDIFFIEELAFVKHYKESLNNKRLKAIPGNETKWTRRPKHGK
jgi:hypothetical protein